MLQLVALAAVAGPAIAGPAQRVVAIAAAAVAWAVFGQAVRRGDATARSQGLMAALLTTAVATGLLWQLAMAAAIGGHVLAARRWPAVAPSSGWRRRGGVPGVATAIVGGVTPFALVAWFVVMRPELGDLAAVYLPDAPLAALVLGGIAFAVGNAVLEELIWRGVITDALERSVSAELAIAIQALSFGVAHFHGFPRGVVGVILAGGWAAMLGWLRRRSGGLLAPTVAHVVADASIATIVLVALR
jgi:membrane protease YdiL (CAAX protease family)